MIKVGTKNLECPRCNAKGPMNHFEGAAGTADQCYVCLFTACDFNKGSGTAGNTRKQFTPYGKKD